MHSQIHCLREVYFVGALDFVLRSEWIRLPM